MQIQPSASDGLTQVERTFLTCDPDDVSPLAHRLVSHLDLLLEIWKAILDKNQTYYEAERYREEESRDEECAKNTDSSQELTKEKGSLSEAVSHFCAHSFISSLILFVFRSPFKCRHRVRVLSALRRISSGYFYFLRTDPILSLNSTFSLSRFLGLSL